MASRHILTFNKRGFSCGYQFTISPTMNFDFTFIQLANLSQPSASLSSAKNNKSTNESSKFKQNLNLMSDTFIVPANSGLQHGVDAMNFQQFDEKLKQDFKGYNPPLIPPKADNFAAYVGGSRALQVLIMFGVELYKVEKHYPETMDFIVKLDFEKEIFPKLQFLKNNGLTPKEFGCAISKNPYILDPKKEVSDLDEITKYLSSKKFTSQQIASLYVRFPTIFNIPVVNLDGILGFYQRIPTSHENKQIIYGGSEVRSMIIRCPTLLAAELEDVFLRVKLFEFSFGFTIPQLRLLLYQRPQILLQDLKQLELLYRLYALEMKLSNEQLAKNAFAFLVRHKVIVLCLILGIILEASWNTSVSAHAVSISKGLGKSVAGYYHTAGKSTEQFVKHKISPPRRALLYVPGHDERKIKKVTDLHVDCVALDCEDGVAFSKKDEARSTIFQLYEQTTKNFAGEVCVRINSPSSGLAEADIEMVKEMPVFPSTLIVPKIDDHTELEWFCGQFVEAYRKHPSLLKTPFHIIFMTESGRGLLNLQKITEAGIAACARKNSTCHLSGVVFGSDDFCANIGISRSDDATELMYARQKVVTVAKAYSLQAIDMVYINYKDEAGLKKQALDGARIGFTGKQIIHPGQIPVVQKCFSPSEEKVEWARELIRTFEESPEGAFTFRGQMIDMPTYLQAKNIERLSQATQTLQNSE